MEEGVDKARGHFDEDGQLALEEVVVVLVLSRRELKVLLDLDGELRCKGGQQLTLKRFFSSLRLFSFFWRSLLRLLLCLS